MSRCILIYGQPASGKTFSLRNLDPDTTMIIDADKKGMLAWKGSKKQFSAEKGNFFKTDTLDSILKALRSVGKGEDWQHFKVLVVDGFNNAMITEVMNYDEVNKTNNKFEKYAEVARKVVNIISTAQNLRDDLTVIFTAHVDPADPYVTNDVDKVFTPGKMLKEKIKLESKFVYVFYAKSEDENFYFETKPRKSTARTPHECLPFKVDNDIAAILKEIEAYEEAE